MYFPDLIEEYKQSLKDLRANSGCLSMQRDLMEAIKWMETGYDPAEHRAATRIDAYVMDHHLMQDLISYVDSDCLTPDIVKNNMERCSDYSNLQEIRRMARIKEDINEALDGLSVNERAVFILVRAERYSYTKAANVLGVSKSSVQVYLRRAEQKIRSNRNGLKKEPSAHTA